MIILPVLFKHSLDMLFLERNRIYFIDKATWLQSHLQVADDKDIPYLLEYLCSHTYATLRAWVKKEEPRSIKELSNLLVAMIHSFLDL